MASIYISHVKLSGIVEFKIKFTLKCIVYSPRITALIALNYSDDGIIALIYMYVMLHI